LQRISAYLLRDGVPTADQLDAEELWQERRRQAAMAEADGLA
jgi:hypothetical protein